jgi:hypothetical protein
VLEEEEEEEECASFLLLVNGIYKKYAKLFITNVQKPCGLPSVRCKFGICHLPG